MRFEHFEQVDVRRNAERRADFRANELIMASWRCNQYLSLCSMHIVNRSSPE